MEYINDTDSLKPRKLDFQLSPEEKDLLDNLKTIRNLYKEGVLTKSDYEYSIALSTKETDLDFNTISFLVESLGEEEIKVEKES